MPRSVVLEPESLPAKMPDQEPVNILLVDDNPANLKALEATLQSPQFRLVPAASGEEALRQVLDAEFAAILMDVEMSKMDGFQTAGLIRDRSADVPIMFLAEKARDKRYEELGYERGAVDYLTRPLDEFALKAKVAVFAELFQVKQALQREIAERTRLMAEIEAEHPHQRESFDREQFVLDGFAARHTTGVTAALHGEKVLREAVPEVFAEMVGEYVRFLNLSLDSRVHATQHDLATGLQKLAARMVFLGAGPRDVVDVHKASVAKTCTDVPVPKARVITEEGRFLLVELMGDLLALYRSQHNRRVASFYPRNATVNHNPKDS